MIRSIAISICTLISMGLFSQLPNTQLYLIEYDFGSKTSEVTEIRYLTSFNSLGYNNQPYLSSESEVYFTSSHEAYGLTDVYRMDLNNEVLTRITQTEESEYSPQLNVDETISVIRQELDDSQPVPQTLWKYPADLSSFGKNVLPVRSDIGYYCWLPNNEVALFIVGERNSLIQMNSITKEEKFISYNIGRCLRYDEQGGLLYVQKLGSTWMIKRRVINEGITQTITPTLDDSEDFEILSNGNLLAGKGSKLFVFDMTLKNGWKEIADLSSAGISEITRIAAKDNKVVLVSRQ